MVDLHDGFGVGEVGGSLRSLQEKGHIFIEHVFTQNGEPLLCQTAFIDASLLLKGYPQRRLPLFGFCVAHQPKRIVKGLVSSDQYLPLPLF